MHASPYIKVPVHTTTIMWRVTCGVNYACCQSKGRDPLNLLCWGHRVDITKSGSAKFSTWIFNVGPYG